MSDNEECFSSKLVLTVVTASLGATNFFMLLLLGMMFIKYRKAAEPKKVSNCWLLKSFQKVLTKVKYSAHILDSGFDRDRQSVRVRLS